MLTILLVDDNTSVRQTTAEILNLEGFRVIEGGDGEEGLRLAREERPNLILCDIMMPHSDGYDLLAKVRALPETASIPFLFLTARGSPEDLRHGMNLGADDYIIKPFHARDLVEAIRGRLKRYHAMLDQYAQSTVGAQVPGPDPSAELAAALRDAPEGVLLRVNLRDLDDVLLALGQEAADACIEAVGSRLVAVSAGRPVFFLPGRGHYCVAAALSEEDARQLGKVMCASVREPLHFGQVRLHLTAAVGLARFPEHASNPAALLSASDWAAKVAIGHGTAVETFTVAMREAAAGALDLSGRIQDSIAAGHFELHYQPILDAAGSLVSTEALVRWNHPELGQISPFRFIPVAEASGDILPLGEWVMRTACQEVLQFRKESALDFSVNINVSVRQFAQEDIAEVFASLLAKSGLPGAAVTLELTESVLARNVSRTIELLESLRSSGARIAIDDFGTGFSSLAYLNQFPLDSLKIDRSLVKDFEAQRSTRTVVESIIAMAHRLDLSVTAEGVETPEQLQILRDLGVDCVQGYYFSRPLPSADFLRYVQEGGSPGS